MYSPITLRVNQKQKIRNYVWYCTALLPKRALIIDFGMNFMNYELQTASSKNTVGLTLFYYSTEITL
jgi:hypothetical protein